MQFIASPLSQTAIQKVMVSKVLPETVSPNVSAALMYIIGGLKNLEEIFRQWESSPRIRGKVHTK